MNHRYSAETNEPRISVVIPTYNNLSLLLECIESVAKQDYPRDKTEIIVVDNGSTDRTREFVRLRFPTVKLVPLETNTGFAVACNRGAFEATGDYIAFLNNDAEADSGWLRALSSTLLSNDDKTVCVASRIMSRDGSEVEFDGASSNLFAAGRPTSVWGWPDTPTAPVSGSPILFASGGAMLIKRSVFLDVGGFDPAYFAYFEDVDLGWRLWVLGYRVVYAPNSVVQHLGGATGKRTGEHRRYVLWESNSLATVLKNYESGNMEKILTAALMLEYKRAMLAAGGAIKMSDYQLGGPPDKNHSNLEQLPKVSVAHLAALDRLNSILPELMESRRSIQSKRVRPDSEILPLLGRPYEPQFAGKLYADASRALVDALGLYGITAQAMPNRVLIVGGMTDTEKLITIAKRLKGDALVAVAAIGTAGDYSFEDGFTLHKLAASDALLSRLVGSTDLLVLTPDFADSEIIRYATVPIAVVGPGMVGREGVAVVQDAEDPALLALARAPR